MDIYKIKALIENNYDIHIKSIEKIKNVYKVKTRYKNYCLKVIKYDFGHFLFIISAIEHLQNNEFEYIPEIIKTKCNSDYINIEGNYAYLMPWINSRQCNYDDNSDVMAAAWKLAELHKKSSEFQVTKNMKPRVGWLKWIDMFKTKKSEIILFKNYIDKKEKLTEFDSIYLSIMNDELKRAEKSIVNLISSNYIEKMNKEKINNTFCHHDFANHNILMSEDSKVNIIDFDYCILDTHLHDVSSLLLRCMKNGKWQINSALSILNKYSSLNEIKGDDVPIMAAFMEFPQDYWQIGIQYYFEKQPWKEEKFLSRLKKIYDDRCEKQDFINEFRNVKYNQ